MKTLEFDTEVTEERTLKIPQELAEQVDTHQVVHVILHVRDGEKQPTSADEKAVAVMATFGSCKDDNRSYAVSLHDHNILVSLPLRSPRYCGSEISPRNSWINRLPTSSRRLTERGTLTGDGRSISHDAAGHQYLHRSPQRRSASCPADARSRQRTRRPHTRCR